MQKKTPKADKHKGWFAWFLLSKGVTAAEFARKSGIPKQHVSNWTRGIGNPSDESLRRIAEVFRCDAREILLFAKSNAGLRADEAARSFRAVKSVDDENKEICAELAKRDATIAELLAAIKIQDDKIDNLSVEIAALKATLRVGVAGAAGDSISKKPVKKAS